MATSIMYRRFFLDRDEKMTFFQSKLTDEQREYLYESYQNNRNPSFKQLREIGQRFHDNSFDFFLELQDWFLDRQLADLESAFHQYQSVRNATQ